MVRLLKTPDPLAYKRHPLFGTGAVTVDLVYDADADVWVTLR